MLRPPAAPNVRLAEYLCCLARGIDLAMGAPPEWVLKGCLLGMRLAQLLGLDTATRSETFYVILLRHVGCSATAGAEAAVFGDELAAHRVFPWAHDESQRWQAAGYVLKHLAEGHTWTRRSELLFRFFAAQSALDVATLSAEHCEVAQQVCEVLALGPEVSRGLGSAYERWDGKGHPHAFGAETIPISARLAAFALDVSWFSSLGGGALAEAMVHRRSGRLHDPALSEVYLSHAAELLASLETTTLREAILEAEPGPPRMVTPPQTIPLLHLFADFADLKSPWFLGFSRRVHDVVAQAGRPLLEDDEWELTRKAALIQGLGRVGISSSIWGKPGPLGQAERDEVSEYPSVTQRVFARSEVLRAAGQLASQVQERVDSSGYPRGLRDQGPGSRLLAAAHMYCALTSDRPQRPALTGEAAARELVNEVKQGRLDRESVQAIMTAVGLARPVPVPDLPFGLTARELDVLRLIAKGRSNKEMARRLGIAEKTAGRHVERLYDKIRVTTRAGATLFAVRNALL